MTPDKKNASRRMKHQIEKFSPPQGPNVTLDEQTLAYKTELEKLQAENNDLTAKLGSLTAIVRSKRKSLANLNTRLAAAEGEGKALQQAVDDETARQKLKKYQTKRAVANGRR